MEQTSNFISLEYEIFGSWCPSTGFCHGSSERWSSREGKPDECKGGSFGLILAFLQVSNKTHSPVYAKGSLSPPNNLPVRGLFGFQGPGEGKLSREEVVAAGVLATLCYLTALGLLRFLLEPVSVVAVPGRRGITATPGEGLSHPLPHSPFPLPVLITQTLMWFVSSPLPNL